MNRHNIFKWTSVALLVGLILSCSNRKEEKAAALYRTQCASCHLLPAIEDLPKHIWKDGVLPDMAARMGIQDSSLNPLKNRSFAEQHAILKSGIYPSRPQLSIADWDLLQNYIINLAPDSLVSLTPKSGYSNLNQFKAVPIQIDSSAGTFITFLEFKPEDHSIITGDLRGNLLKHHLFHRKIDTLEKVQDKITSYAKTNTSTYITTTRNLNPSEIANGAIDIIPNSKDTIIRLPEILHRPVHTLARDLNKNSEEELVVSEFGNLTGSLSLFSKEGGEYKKNILLNQPGFIRTIAKDMNHNGKDDLVALVSQGRESIIIFYQQDNLQFVPEPVLEFSPVYGTSWFELIDYDGDGDDDIITVNGDNADKSFVNKPYHGLRIHINDGTNTFEEKYFFPLNGATRLVAEDFDQDGDYDFGIVSTFPDYTTKPFASFVYLENKDSKAFNFQPYTFSGAKLGRWLLMDSGDVDNDGDIDIVLSSFTYGFSPVPKDFLNVWSQSKVDLMLLENKLK
ncbi:VCBS repeat-containing protein [Zobellia sp.]|nr:VCBS repeat-containing protein [Zobellia sp.]